MACDECLKRFDKQYLRELARLSIAQRLTDKGKRLVAQYGERISTPCQHQTEGAIGG